MCFTKMSFLSVAFTQQLSCFSPSTHLCLSAAHLFLTLHGFTSAVSLECFLRDGLLDPLVDSKDNKCNSMNDSCIIALLNEAQTCTAGGRQPDCKCVTTLRATSAITWL